MDSRLVHRTTTAFLGLLTALALASAVSATASADDVRAMAGTGPHDRLPTDTALESAVGAPRSTVNAGGPSGRGASVVEGSA